LKLWRHITLQSPNSREKGEIRRYFDYCEIITTEYKWTIKESDFEILEMETDKDHIHFLIKSEPKISVLAIVRRLKQESTIRLWKTQKEYLRKYY
jgi:REP element-mobilizing transposase RayT